jgi:5-methyltetrahydropteroyltriglutamate--homocysteine methyltransferase
MTQQRNSSDLHGKLKTSVVDSLPLDKTQANMERIVDDQISLGIDFPIVPQLEDMSLMFLEPLAEQNCGIEIKNGITRVIGDLIPPIEPFVLPELIWTKNYMKNAGFQNKIDGIKIYITGPFTLAYFIKIADMPALLMPDIVEKLAYIIKKIVYDIDKEGVAIITIYEHILNFAIAQFAIEEDFALKCLDIVFKGVSKAIGALHVCEDVFSVAKLLLQLDNVVYLDHDFVSSPENLVAYKKQDLEQHDKLIGYGCVATSIDPLLLDSIRRGEVPWEKAVETEGEVKARILKAIDRYGVENIIIDPDCAFGNLKFAVSSEIAYSITLAKLKSMMAATKALRKEFRLDMP